MLGQSFADWEWIIVDDGGKSQAVETILEDLSRSDGRVTVRTLPTNSGIVAASNAGLTLCRGRYLALLDHDDVLDSQALKEFSRVIEKHPGVDYIYSDEDKIDSDGTRFGPFFKPGWSPELLRQLMYTCHLSVLRMDRVRDVGGFRQRYEGAQDYDLVLRVTELATNVRHIPRILYHWRAHSGSTAASSDQKPYAHVAAKKAVADHISRQEIIGQVREHPSLPGHWRIHRQTLPAVRASLCIPTRGLDACIWRQDRSLIANLVRSIESAPTDVDFEYVIVYDSRTSPETLDELARLCSRPLRLVKHHEGEDGFNYAEKANLAAKHAQGDVLVFINDDIQVISHYWLDELVALTTEPEVGAVGARLLYPDQSVQHAGVTLAPFSGGMALHVSYQRPIEATGNGGLQNFTREVAAVTGALVGIARSKFMAVGGYSESLAVNFNDIDLCMKLRFLGMRILYCPFIEAFHFESKSRSKEAPASEIQQFRRRWGKNLLNDTYRNPNLDPQTLEEYADWAEVVRSAAFVVGNTAELVQNFEGYLDANPDLAGMSFDAAIRHFKEIGRYEGRACIPRERSIS